VGKKIMFSNYIDRICNYLVFNKYQKQGKLLAPMPPGHGIGGHLKESTAKRYDFNEEVREQYGDLVRLRFFDAPTHFLFHPDDIKRVFVTNNKNYQKNDPGYKRIKNLLGKGLLSADGKDWTKGRKLLQPMFAHKSSREHIPDMVSIINKHIERVSACEKNGEVVDLSKLAVDLSLDMSCDIIFGGASGKYLDEVKDHYKIAQGQMVDQLNSAVGIFTPMFIPIKTNRIFLNSKKILVEASKKIIAFRRKEPGKDFITKMINAKDSESGDVFSEQDIIDQVLTFLFSAHETTANFMSWSWYMISKHPEVQSEVLAELDENIKGDVPTEEELDRCTLFNQCLLEANRLYPPIWIIMRQAIDDDILGGYFVPKGSLIFISPYTTHRHPDFYENPNKFLPSRWTDEFFKKVNNHAYFPFGLGPRNCIGRNFSTHEVRFTLSMFFKNFSTELADDKTETDPQILLFPKNGINVNVKAR